MRFFLLISLSLIPATMVVIALAWRRRPPGTINWVFGYRTDWSMKNRDTWDFAHRYVSMLWLRLGIPLWLLSIAAWYWGTRYGNKTLEKITTVVTILQCVLLLSSILPTEIALRRTFDAGGKRKSS